MSDPNALTSARDSAFDFDVFVSHSSRDQEWVLGWLIPKLEAAVIKPCYFQEDFDPTRPILKNIALGVKQSRKTVLVLSPDWLNSEWTELEALIAQQQSPAFRKQQLIVLMLRKCAPPTELAILPNIDFTDESRRDKQLQRLIDAINDKLRLRPRVDRALILPQSDDPQLFTGRDEELKKLEALLVTREGPKVCSIIGVAGTGGIGKSALACHFAEIFKDAFPDGVFGLRVDGKSTDVVAREFARSAGEIIEADDERDGATIMKEVFRHRRALLIFDNADNAEIRHLRPGGDRCAVIVTTRDRHLPSSLGIPDFGRLDLQPLPEPDSRELLEKLLGRDRVAAESVAADEIIELVGNLPLALRIVGAVLQLEVWTKLSEFAGLLREERERLSRLKVRDDISLDVRASLSLSLKHLQESEIDFLACLSVCAQDGFSARAAMAAGGVDEQTAKDGMAYLYRLSLLNRAESQEPRFVFHPLVRVFARELADERGLQADAAARHASFYVGLVKGSNSADRTDALLSEELDDILLAAEWLLQQRDDDYEFVIRLEPFLQRNGYWEQADKLMSGFLSLAESVNDWNAVVQLRIQKAKFLTLRSDLAHAQEVLSPIENVLIQIEPPALRDRCEAMWLNTLGGVALRLGDFDKAIGAFRRSTAFEERQNNHRGLAKTLNSLGSALQRQGHFDEASDAFQHSALIEQQLGHHFGEAMVLNSLGGVLVRQGRFDKAMDAFSRSYDLLVEIGDQRGQAMVLNSLGGAKQRVGRFVEAEEALRRSADIEDELGNNRGQAMVLNSLGGVLQRMGRFDEAEAAFNRSLAISEQLEDQRSLAMVLNSLGGVLQRVGRFDEAEGAFKRSAEIGEVLDDRRHLAMVLNSLGGVLQRMGRFDEAEVAFKRSIQIGERLGDRLQLAMVLNSLGGVLQRMGRFDEAEVAFRRSLAISEQLEDQRSLAMVLNSLGGVLQRMGRFDEAEVAFKRSLGISEQLEDRRSLAMVLNSLGGVLQRMSRFDEAEATLKRSLAISEQLEDQRSLAMVLNSLGGVLQRMGRFDAAEAAFNRSLAISEQLEDQRSLAMVLNSLGGVLQRMGRFDEAEVAFKRSYDLLVEMDELRGQAMVLNSLGGVLQRLDRFDEAEVAFKHSAEIGEVLHDHKHLAIVLNSLGGVLQRMGRFDEAEAAFIRCAKLEDELGNKRGQAMMLNSLGGVLQRMGRFDEAEVTFKRSLAISEKLKDQRSLAMVLNSLGGVLQRMGRFDEAEKALKRSFDISDELGDQVSLAMVHFGIGKLLRARRQHEQALAEFRQSFEINERLGLVQGVGIVTPLLAESFLKLKRRGEAMSYCERALVIAPQNAKLRTLHNQLSSEPHSTDQIKTGSIKVIKRDRRGDTIGFIVPDDGTQDIFFHESSVESRDLARLTKGCRVEAAVERSPRGLNARYVKILS